VAQEVDRLLCKHENPRPSKKIEEKNNPHTPQQSSSVAGSFF
jgi:hypothetical protein